MESHSHRPQKQPAQPKFTAKDIKPVKPQASVFRVKTSVPKTSEEPTQDSLEPQLNSASSQKSKNVVTQRDDDDTTSCGDYGKKQVITVSNPTYKQHRSLEATVHEILEEDEEQVFIEPSAPPQQSSRVSKRPLEEDIGTIEEILEEPQHYQNDGNGHGNKRMRTSHYESPGNADPEVAYSALGLS